MRITQIGTVVCAALLVGGCGWFESSAERGEGKSTVAVTFNEEQFQRDKEAYQREAELRIAAMDARLQALNVQAKVAAGDAKANLDKAIVEQQANLEKARGDFKEVQAATKEKWADVKARSSAALDDLQKGFDNAVSRFK